MLDRLENFTLILYLKDENSVFSLLTQPWMSRAYDPCTERYSQMYFNLPEVQNAMHANVTRISYPWESCRYS